MLTPFPPRHNSCESPGSLPEGKRQDQSHQPKCKQFQHHSSHHHCQQHSSRKQYHPLHSRKHYHPLHSRKHYHPLHSRKHYHPLHSRKHYHPLHSCKHYHSLCSRKHYHPFCSHKHYHPLCSRKHYHPLRSHEHYRHHDSIYFQQCHFTRPGPCKEDSCSSDASCVGLNNSYFCLCTDGYYYNSSTCNKGKVFPGTIKVKVPETSGLEDEKSLAYQNLYVEITKFFADAFKNPDYGQTVIHKVRISAPARSEMRAGDKLVDVTVVNLFAETSEENETTVSNAINKAVASNPNTFSNYTKENRCDFYGCVNEQDDCRDILVCKCKPGLSRPNPQTALCLALGPKCLDTCNAEHNMQCLVQSNGSSNCMCLPGYQKGTEESCQACAFGYSGVDCQDSFQLILTIVGTVAGILILSMVIALIFLRSKTKGIEEQNLIEDDYHSLRMSTTGFSNLGAEGSLFPKVRATFPKDSPMQNPYAQRSMPRPDY
ncbi:PREDICTED: mucin-13 [Myotis brandtii]|uniref:mucin-13 n=1 Tax=Myotis brandtii TaxID=109478 RepID=UPI00070429DA|nr:PREDICTED: mucin-13 [Myotis brandtii]